MRKQMRETGQIWKAGLPYLLSLCLFLGGCGFNEDSRMSNLYSFEERPITLDLADDGSGYAQLFAKNLRVIKDGGAFAAGDAASEAGTLFDTTRNQVLCSKNSYERLCPVSITKMMTTLLVVKYGNLSDTVMVTEDAVVTESGAALCGIKPGDTSSMEQPLYGLILPSGNDAGAAIAVHMSGSIPAFANLMNEEAKRFGATGTHFVNPHGLSGEGHYITAYDLYFIFNEALKYLEFRQVTGTVTYTADYVDKDGNPVSQTWKGNNQFMTDNRETPEGLIVFSGKTGATQTAGYCLIMATKDPQGREYVSVVSKADSRPGLYDNTTNITRKIVD